MRELPGRVSVKRIFTAVILVAVFGGSALAIFGPLGPSDANVYSLSYPGPAPRGTVDFVGAYLGSSNGSPQPTTYVVQSPASTSTGPPRYTSGNQWIGLNAQGAAGNSTGGNGGFLQFSSEIAIKSVQPSKLAGRIVLLAFSLGGYVAYQSTVQDSAFVVIRVPASQYQQALSQIQSLGNVTSLVSNSNDVTVKYTDLNATLKSLVVEQNALLRLVNQSTSISTTLVIEGQLQQVDSQINQVQSQILQTRTLIQYSTISVSLTKEAQRTPLSMVLSATPRSGTSPLSVTFNAIVKGGIYPYFVTYNFGDGTSAQGQIVVHQFVGSGDFNATVSTTDSNGTVAAAFTIIHINSPPGRSGLEEFLGTVSGLFLRVIEGIIEVAVVVIPLGLVAVAVLYPLQKRARSKTATDERK